MEINTVILSRKELYELVWSTPLINLSRNYLISDNGLRKICKRMNIPLPVNGHWMKLQYGKKVRVYPLTEDPAVEQAITLEFRKAGEQRTGNPLKNWAKEITIEVPLQLSSPDPLIVAAKKRLTGKEAVAYYYAGMVECKQDELDIRVAPVNLERALRIMDALIKELRARQYEIYFRTGETYSKVKGEELKFALHEKGKRVTVTDRNWNRTELHPTGLLSIKVGRYSSKVWEDSAKNPGRRLETLLPEVIAFMEQEADYWNEARADRERKQEARKVREEQARAIEQRKAEELAAFKVLLQDSERWQLVQRLREYVDEVGRRGTAVLGWIEWASQKIDWYDPFIGREDHILGKWNGS